MPCKRLEVEPPRKESPKISMRLAFFWRASVYLVSIPFLTPRQGEFVLGHISGHILRNSPLAATNCRLVLFGDARCSRSADMTAHTATI
jgi:hypothetical protein